MQTLHETYERCFGAPQFELQPLNPVSSVYQDTQIQVTVNGAGEFRRAEMLELPDTMIPVSEESAARSGSDPKPNPLSDKLAYCAADIADYGGDGERFGGYERNLAAWCGSEFADQKASAVLKYLQKKTLIRDLVQENVLEHKNGKLARLKIRPTKTIEAKDAWVRWRVEIPGVLEANTWKDAELFRRWTRFEESQKTNKGTCMVTGNTVRTARIHPRGIRTNSDRAKLITSNDKVGFTFRGRFGSADQAAVVGYEVTQKAHNALRWLIRRQGARASSSQVYIAWDVRGNDIPDPLASTAELLGLGGESTDGDLYAGDAGEMVALRLRSKIQGYKASLGDTSKIGIMGLDTAADETGRLAITYYRELTGSDFLQRIESWHAENSWLQPVSENENWRRGTLHAYRWYVGAPSPKAIASAAFGADLESESGKRLLFATLDRLLPCLVEGRPIPRDIVVSCVRRATNRLALQGDNGDELEWEKCLGVACALVRGSEKGKDYKMSLEENRTTRDYLFGRLLAIGEDIEQHALWLADEKRVTNAARLTQRFADHPCSTWRNIVLLLNPYRARLRAVRPGLLFKRDKLLDAVNDMFVPADFVSDARLGGEFLLGYHCQRAALRRKEKPDGVVPDDDIPTSEGDEE